MLTWETQELLTNLQADLDADSPLALRPVNACIYSVYTPAGEHVGNLKLIGGTWKFKAIGYDANGNVIPGGGPLTARHNAGFAAPDETLVGALFSPK